MSQLNFDQKPSTFAVLRRTILGIGTALLIPMAAIIETFLPKIGLLIDNENFYGGSLKRFLLDNPVHSYKLTIRIGF